MATLIALDASVIIALLDRRDALHHQAMTLFESHVGEPLCASVLTMAEVLVAPVRLDMGDAVAAALERLGIEAVPLADDQLALAQLRATTRLKLPDCCVLLAAERRDARLATFDRRLAATARERGLDVLGQES